MFIVQINVLNTLLITNRFVVLSIILRKSAYFTELSKTVKQTGRCRGLQPFPFLYFLPPNSRSDLCNLLVSEKSALFSLVKLYKKTLSSSPPCPDFTASFPDCHIGLTDQHLGRQVAGKQPDLPPPAGTAPPRPGSAALAQHLSGPGRHMGQTSHSKSKRCTSLKRLGTPGLTCIRYNTEYPEIISPLHNDTVAERTPQLAHTHSQKKKKHWSEMTKQSTIPGTFAESDCGLVASFQFFTSLVPCVF